MYLNDTSLNPSDWTCEPCPMGGDCSKPVTWKNIGPKFGWWKIPQDQRDPTTSQMFAECLYPPACLGAPNHNYEGRYVNEDGVDLALAVSSSIVTSACSLKLGFANNSRLCHTCAKKFRRQSSHQCATCPDDAASWGVMILVK